MISLTILPAGIQSKSLRNTLSSTQNRKGIELFSLATMSTFGIVVVFLLSIAVVLFMRCDNSLFTLRLLPYNETTAHAEKVIWVTGASTGIGAGLAFDLCKAGAQVILSARQEDKLNEVAKRCVDIGALAPYVLPLDVLNTEAHILAYETITTNYGRLDSLVLNPGRSQRKLAVDTTLEDTRSLFDLNFFSYVSLAKAVLPDMIKRGSGQIVVMSSLSGKLGTPVASSYSSTKFALHGYFDALRTEVQHLGVSVSLLCPGPVVSEILEHTTGKMNVKESEARMPTERCTDLISRAMKHKVDELWISDQPLLLVTYMMEYTPWLGRQIMTKFAGILRLPPSLTSQMSFYLYYHLLSLHLFAGPSRSKMLAASSGDMYSLSQMLGFKKATKETIEL